MAGWSLQGIREGFLTPYPPGGGSRFLGEVCLRVRPSVSLRVGLRVPVRACVFLCACVCLCVPLCVPAGRGVRVPLCVRARACGVCACVGAHVKGCVCV